nr:unnamed protein product [Spirometra erinaceieuropaei]
MDRVRIANVDGGEVDVCWFVGILCCGGGYGAAAADVEAMEGEDKEEEEEEEEEEEKEEEKEDGGSGVSRVRPMLIVVGRGGRGDIGWRRRGAAVATKTSIKSD